MKHKVKVQQLINNCRECHGFEVFKDWWPVADEVVKHYPDEFELGPARGPGKDWKRLEYIGAD